MYWSSNLMEGYHSFHILSHDRKTFLIRLFLKGARCCISCYACEASFPMLHPLHGERAGIQFKGHSLPLLHGLLVWHAGDKACTTRRYSGKLSVTSCLTFFWNFLAGAFYWNLLALTFCWNFLAGTFWWNFLRSYTGINSELVYP